MRIYKRLFLILLSSVMLILSFTDNLAFLSWFALISYIIALSKSNFRSAIFLSALTGLLFFAGITYWFTEYSYVYWFPILGLLSVFFIFYGFIFKLIFLKIKWACLRILLISSVWIAVEFLRHRTFLAFPWGVLGYSQHSFLPVMQLSKLTGVLGVSLLIVLLNLCCAEIIMYFINLRLSSVESGSGIAYISAKTNFNEDFNNKASHQLVAKSRNKPGNHAVLRKSFFKKPVFIFSITVVAVILLNVIFGTVYIRKNSNQYEGEKLEIAMVQPNVLFDDKFATDTDVLIPQRMESDKKYFKEGTELIVFPESVIWGLLEQERNNSFYKWVRNTAAEENLYFTMGQIVWDEENNYYNTVYLYNPKLEIIGRYDKIHPLPCAEYMPYPDIFGFLSFMNIAKLNITPAKELILLNYPGKGNIGANICFESTLQIISRTYRKTGADILFTFTDTAGFRESIAAWHHVIFSKTRAIENNCFMVHSGNNGISAVIDPYGRILAKTEIGKREILYGSVYLNNKKSFYSLHGELFIYIYFGASFIVLLFYIIKVKNKKKQDEE
jgi:apolipoprotein N-acyltransferase